MKRTILIFLVLLCIISLISCNITEYFKPNEQIDTSNQSVSEESSAETSDITIESVSEESSSETLDVTVESTSEESNSETETQPLPQNKATEWYNSALNELCSDNALFKIEFFQSEGVSEDPEFDDTASGYIIIDGDNLLVYTKSDGVESTVTIIGNTIYESLTENGKTESKQKECSPQETEAVKAQLCSFLTLILKLDNAVLDKIEMDTDGFSLQPSKNCYTDFINTMPDGSGFAPGLYLVYFNEDGSFKSITNTYYCVFPSNPGIMIIQSVTLNFLDGATHITPPTQN